MVCPLNYLLSNTSRDYFEGITTTSQGLTDELLNFISGIKIALIY